jgi:hypothetical protein
VTVAATANNNEVQMSALDAIARFFGGGDPADASPYHRAISEHYGLDQEPAPWPYKNGRKVATNELPPERIPITGKNSPLPHGIREVKHGEARQGWPSWKPRESQDTDHQRMNDYLRDGALDPKRLRQ